LALYFPESYTELLRTGQRNVFSPRKLAADTLLASSSRSAVLRYGCAFLTTALAFVATRWMADFERAPYFPFFIFAVLFTAFYAGWRPALLGIVLSTLINYFAFITPFYKFGFARPNDAFRLGVFIALCTIMAGLVELLRSGVTQLRLAQRKIAEQGEQYRVTLTSIGDAVIAVDVEERVRFMNRIAESLTGWRLDEAVGQRLQDIFNVISELTRKPLESPVSRALSSGLVVELENDALLLGRDSTALPIDDSASPIHNASGNVIGAVLIFRDVSRRRTDEKEKEQLLRREQTAKQDLIETVEELRRSEKRFRTIVDSNMIAVCFWDVDGRVLDANDRYLRLVGYSREDFNSAGLNWRDITPKEQWKLDDEAIRQTRKSGACSSYEKEYIRKDGTRVPVLLALAMLASSEKQGVACFFDLSERKLVEKLTEEKLYLEGEIRTEYNFEEIVGQSSALKLVLGQVETVAPTDSTALILGESGTGKELIARAIHDHSARRESTFVKLNCAAIPTGLLESELFGHEKGAFTGAIAQRLGRLELAHRGTLFLDEVGDIPLELQPKLLRVLQEKEFERLGSTRTIHVDIRLIAATHRNLEQMVKDGNFREDLYYRLKVFPIHVPPLRDRTEDIQLLVRYFVEKHAKKIGRKIETISGETMQALTRWHWPGNVRELENLLERSVILSSGPELRVPLAELKAGHQLPDNDAKPTTLTTLDEAERQAILAALRESHGIIAGPKGAAARLGMKRTTLNSKMRKLGISRTKLWT
jgi:PAS domain S-box-containing protein